MAETTAEKNRRNRIALEQRERLVRAFEDPHEDYLLVADALGVHRSTARSIVARYLREGRVAERPRGGRHNVRVDKEMKDCLSGIINENCLLTLTEINAELRRRLPIKPHVHDRTVARTLDGMFCRIKLARPIPAERNRPDVIQGRIDYANWFMANDALNHYVFVDECRYNIWTARSHGQAGKGEKSYRQVCRQRGRNVTVTVAVSPINGLVFHSAIVGVMNAQRFSEFLRQARQRLNPDENVVFIYDGAPAHLNLDSPSANTELKMLPAHSSFLNIMEQVESALTAAIKADVSRPEVQAQMNAQDEARRQGIALGEYRQQLLLMICLRNIGTITAHKCSQWYRFMQAYLPRCLSGEEIDG